MLTEEYKKELAASKKMYRKDYMSAEEEAEEEYRKEMGRDEGSIEEKAALWRKILLRRRAGKATKDGLQTKFVEGAMPWLI